MKVCGGGRSSGAMNDRRRGSRFEVNAKKGFATRSAALRLDSSDAVRCSYQSVGDEQFNVSPTHSCPDCLAISCSFSLLTRSTTILERVEALETVPAILGRLTAKRSRGCVVMRKEAHAGNHKIKQSQGCLKLSFPVENGSARVWGELRSEWHDRNDIGAGVDLD